MQIGIITKKLGGYESKKSTYIVIIPEILTAATISFLAFTKNFYIYNINLILFFCFISIGSPVIQGYLIKTIPKSIKGIGVGLDMIVVPGDITPETISAIIADEAAIGMVNTKTTAVRLIPAVGFKAGDVLEFGGLLGSGPVMPVRAGAPDVFINRGGRIPAPLQALKN